MRTKVLVTGGSGFVGQRLLAQLRGSGYEVRNLDLNPCDAFADVTRIGDVRSAADCSAALAGMDAVVHLAALYRDDVRPRERYYDTNVGGTRQLLAAATACGVRQVVFTSSFSVYGLDDAGRSEDGALAPVNDYGRSKLQAEALLAAWQADAPGRVVRALRPCVIFGEGNRGNVYTLIEQVASGRFVMVGNGANRKSMAYVGNVARCLEFLLQQNEPGLEIYNYADKPDLSVREIVDTIAGTLRRRVRRVPAPKLFALAAGALADVASRISGTPLTVSSERVRKFFANTTLPTDKLKRAGFIAPVEWREAFVGTILHEFGGREAA